MAEFLYNSFVSYINQGGGMGSADTTVQLIDTTLFPTICNYRICIDSETMLVTSNVAGLLTVTRGVEGTTATAHANQTPVFLVITAGGLNAWTSGGGGGLVGVGGSAYTNTSISPVATTWTSVPVDGSSVLYGGCTIPGSGLTATGIKPNTAGTYVVLASLGFGGTPGAGSQVGVGKNGSPVANAYMGVASAGSQGLCSTVLSLLSTDVVNMMAYDVTGSVAIATGLSRLTVFRVN